MNRTNTSSLFQLYTMRFPNQNKIMRLLDQKKNKTRVIKWISWIPPTTETEEGKVVQSTPSWNEDLIHTYEISLSLTSFNQNLNLPQTTSPLSDTTTITSDPPIQIPNPCAQMSSTNLHTSSHAFHNVAYQQVPPKPLWPSTLHSSPHGSVDTCLPATTTPERPHGQPNFEDKILTKAECIVCKKTLVNGKPTRESKSPSWLKPFVRYYGGVQIFTLVCFIYYCC